MADSPSVISQKDVDMILIRLQELREQLKVAREAEAPLIAKLALAYQEYEMAVGRLRRETNRLEVEINMLRAQIEGVGRDQEDTDFLQTLEYRTTLGNRPEDVTVDPDAIEKDVLLEHLFRVLDDGDDDLLSALTGICNDPTIGLADALERVPWGRVWIAKGPQETLVTQYRRLAAWESALSKQLEELQWNSRSASRTSTLRSLAAT